MAASDETSQPEPDPLDSFRQLVALPRDVFVLSVAMFAFSLGFQMTSRYLPRYLPRYVAVLGASNVVIGLYGTAGNVIGAVYPTPAAPSRTVSVRGAPFCRPARTQGAHRRPCRA